ncbi:MAG: MutS family DNA mismatch repair protein [Ginsengibacter sp.]
MEIDKTTLRDLSIFDNEESFSIFDKLNLTLTTGGATHLRYIFNHPLKSLEEITAIQETTSYLQSHESEWPKQITNGTLMVIHKFYETALDQIPAHPTVASALQYKLLHGPDFSLAKYSTSHAFDFIVGMEAFINLNADERLPKPLKKVCAEIKKILGREQLLVIRNKSNFKQLNIAEYLKFAYFIRYTFKENIYNLIDLFYKLDAWRSMGLANKKLGLCYPKMIEKSTPHLHSEGLYHLLLSKPTSYDVILDNQNNFIFLTGANMAGKSTFIKSVGSAVFLAHVGMGVPATKMELSFFDGMLSNINVVDNISKGESYFYNEVQRIKNTILKITDGRKWLVLIDELFKGTNVEDAMTCSSAVIKGLIKIKSSLFILSTHLYEIGEGLKPFENISFKYFETTVSDEQLHFSYQLQNGISNDRLGYLILKREKVIELIDQISD